MLMDTLALQASSSLTPLLKRKQTGRLTRRLCAVTATICLHNASLHSQPIVDWVTVGGSAQSDVARNMTVSPAGEIYLPGFFDWDGNFWSSVQTILYRYDRNGSQLGSLPSRGELLESVAVDAAGNYHVTGRVWRPEDLGMGVRQDFYIAKYAANGTRLWERTAGATIYSDSYLNAGFSIALDSAGNSYVAGASHGPGTFGSVTFPNTAGGPMLCKYDPAGTLLWAKRAEGHWATIFGLDTRRGGGLARSILLDSVGNIVIAGKMFNGAATFNGIVITIAGPYAGTAESGDFIAKYDPAGQILWAKPVPFGGLAVDYQGNVVISGSMTNGQAKFDGTSTTVDDPSGYNSFVAKFNPAGTLLWVKAAPMGSLAADSKGNIYSGPSKLDEAGTLIWARAIPGASLNLATLNDRDEPVFTGGITGTVHLDEHVVQADSNSLADSVICKTDKNGTFQWAFGLVGGGVGNLRVVGGPAGAIYVSGELGNCVWDATAGTMACYDTALFGAIPVSLQSGGNRDLFLARITDPAPVELKIATTASGLTLSWPAEATDYVLEITTSLPAVSWTPVTNTPTVAGTNRSVQLPVTGTARFFRLRKP